jgi:hypothetical protein
MRRTHALLAGLAILLAGCGGQASPSAPSEGSPRTSQPAFDEVGYDALMLRLSGPDGLTGALAQVSAANYGELAIGAPYVAPLAVVRSQGAGTATACGPAAPLDAAYCRQDRILAVDEELLRRAYASFEVAGPMVILAHEWGHHLASQASLSRLDVREELMADCLAGLFLARHLPVELGEADARSAAALVFVLGGDQLGGSPWFDPSTHGDPAQRVGAFLAGLGGSASLCSDYWSWQPVAPMSVGGYRWVPPPAGEVERLSSNGVSLLAADRAAFLQAGQTTAQSALALLPEVFATTQGRTAQLIGSPVVLPMQGGAGGWLGGSAAAQGYAFLPDGGTTGRGIFLVHLSTTGEALILRTFDARPPPVAGLGGAEWATLRNWTIGLLGGTCPPDGAGVLCGALAAP